MSATFFYPTFTNVFLIFSTFFYVFNVFYFHLNVYYIYGRRHQGVWGVRRTTHFAAVPRREYNAGYAAHLRGTAAGRAAKVTQFTFGFNTWKFCFLYSLLLQRHWKFDRIRSSILNSVLLKNFYSSNYLVVIEHCAYLIVYRCLECLFIGY